MHPMKKVAIVIDEAALKDVVRLLQRAGTKGFTTVPNVGGEGHRGIRSGGDIFDVFQNTMILTIVPEALAARIVRDVLELLQDHAGVVWTEDVHVARPDHFR
jgi:nitrogen regulatory protein PII